MAKPVVEIVSDKNADLYFQSRLWRRVEEEDGEICWYEVRNGELIDVLNSSREKILERAFQDKSLHNVIQRFPRLGDLKDIKEFSEIPTLDHFEYDKDRWLIDSLISTESLVLLPIRHFESPQLLLECIAEAISKCNTQFLRPPMQSVEIQNKNFRVG